jgi:hypothetical protein
MVPCVFEYHPAGPQNAFDDAAVIESLIRIVFRDAYGYKQARLLLDPG